MRKLFLITFVLFFPVLVFGAFSSSKAQSNSWWASMVKIVQDLMSVGSEPAIVQPVERTIEPQSVVSQPAVPQPPVEQSASPVGEQSAPQPIQDRPAEASLAEPRSAGGGGGGLAEPIPTTSQPVERPVEQSAEKPRPRPVPRPVIEDDDREEREEFVDQREIRQVLKEIKSIKKELQKFVKRIAKISNGSNDVNEINAFIEQMSSFETQINSGSSVRDAIQDYRDSRPWDEINKLRTKIELPNEIKQWNKDIKSLERILKHKKIQTLGLNLDNVRSRIGELKTALAKAQEYYNGGNLEDAADELSAFRSDFHPGDIMNVAQRMQEITSRLKKVKDQDVQNKIQEIFSEIMVNFNDGEYQISRELMDESYGEILKMIDKVSSIGKKRGYTKESFIKMTDQLEAKVKNKAEEKKARQD